MRPQLVIFDWDGTLADSQQRIVQALRQALVEHGVDPPASLQVSTWIGMSLTETFNRLAPDCDDRARERLIRRYRQLWALGLDQPSPLFAGTRACLEELSSRGVLLAVATGKSRHGFDRDVVEHGLGRFFVSSRCADESANKPSPEMLLEILSELQIAPRDALMVGDTSFDMEMARDAGVARIGVLSGVHERARLLPFEPLGIIDDVSTLTDWLDVAKQS